MKTKKWTTDAVLAESRRRTADLVAQGKDPAHVQQMLADLLQEAGWQANAFIRALLQDVIAHPPIRRKSGTMVRPGLTRVTPVPDAARKVGGSK